MDRRVTAVLGICLLTIACNAAGAGPVTLDGRTFLSIDVSVNGVPQPLVPSTRIQLSFQDGSVGATAGCNHMGGEYRIENGRLIVESLAMTEMGCDPARHAQDADVAAWLTSRPQLRLNGPELVLETDGVLIRLLDREVADPDRPLTGTQWVLTTIVEGDAAMSVPDGVVATLEFTDDGNFSIRACNQGGGRYSVEGGTITFSEVMLTRMACIGPLGDVEAAMLEVIEAGQVGYAIDADTLTLNAGERGLGFSAQAER